MEDNELEDLKKKDDKQQLGSLDNDIHENNKSKYSSKKHTPKHEAPKTPNKSEKSK